MSRPRRQDGFPESGSQTIMKVPRDGSGPAVPIVSNVWRATIALTDTDVYFTGNSGLIHRLSKSGGPVADLAKAPDDTSRLLALGTTLFVENKMTGNVGIGAISSCPLLGGAVTTLAPEQGSPQDMTAYGGFLFWTTWAGDGTVVKRMPQAGGDIVSLIVDPDANRLARDGAMLYWSTKSAPYASIRRMVADGGGVEQLDTAWHRPEHLGFDNEHVYWNYHALGSFSGCAGIARRKK